MNREVNLTKRVETAQGWRYCPVVLSALEHSPTGQDERKGVLARSFILDST
jgi:hypothetical protein